MFPRALRIVRISGVDVRVDPTWVIIAALFVWSFFARYAGARPSAVALMMAVAATAGFFASILAHEFAHALEAKSRGLEVTSITLFLFGGVTEIISETKRARDEFAVAAVGPYSSLVIASTLGLITAGLDEWVPAAAAVTDVTGVLAWINLALALFNLIPGAPLDGGRVLRAAVWAVTKDRYRAARWAARAGQGVAVLLWALAVWFVVDERGSLLDAAWFGFIGWFLFNAARAERATASTLEALDGHTAQRLLDGGHPDQVTAGTPLGVVEARIGPGGEVLVVTDDETAEPVGILSAEAVRAVPAIDRGFRTARDVMRPLRDLPRAAVDDRALDVLRLLQRFPAVALHDGQTLVAIISREQGEQVMRSLTTVPS